MRTEQEIKEVMRLHDEKLDCEPLTFIYASQIRASRDTLAWVLEEK